MNIKHTVLLLALLVGQLCIAGHLFAQNAVMGDVVIKEIPGNKNAIFDKDSVISYNFNLKNTYRIKQEGRLSYTITTPHGKLVAHNAIPVSLNALSSNIVRLDMPGQKTGFYKVNFMLNLNDYDDTVRRVFGVDINHIKSASAKPADFDQFWSNTKTELAKVKPAFKVTERPDLSGANDDVFLVEMQSLGNITVRAWMTLPKDRKPGEKLPAYIMLPGYGAELVPFRNVPHFACLAINVRGLGNSADVISPTREEYVTHNIEDKNKYIYRGAIMDCVRLLDFVSVRAEFDSTAVFVTGGSMGGYLALALASVDKRVTLCAANNPTFSDYRELVGNNEFPMYDIERYARAHALKMDNVLKTLDYFDLKNFAPAINCKTHIAIGLLDKFAPPATELAAYNLIDSNKTLYIYPDLGHEVDAGLATINGKWVYENLRIYERVMAQTPINGEAPSHVETLKGPRIDEVDIEEKPLAKDAIFKPHSKISYSIDIRNSYNTVQEGTISYQVSTTDDRILNSESVAVRLSPKSVKKIQLDMPPQGAGFYKVNFAINVTDYDDTIRRVFGVDPIKIRSATAKPPGFDQFWDDTIRELAAVEPNFKMIQQPQLEQQNTDVYLIEMQSLGNITVRGYLTIRKDRRPNEKFPVWVLVPGYGLTGVNPVYGSTEVAVLSLNVRGEGNSRDVIKPTRVGYLTTDIEDRKKYIYRGAIMDCIRGIDFICTRPELDSKSIICGGGSMGGYLAIVASSLDKRIKLCSANNPVFADYRSLPEDNWPMRDVKQYAADNALDYDAIVNNLDYYDLKNFAPKLKCKTLLGISLLDNLAPPYNQFAMMNNIPNKNKLFIYPNLGHEVPPSLFGYLGKWMIDNFGLF